MLEWILEQTKDPDSLILASWLIAAIALGIRRVWRAIVDNGKEDTPSPVVGSGEQANFLYLLDKTESNEEAIEDLAERVARHDELLEQLRSQLTVVHGRQPKQKTGPEDYTERISKVSELLKTKTESEVINVVLRWGYTKSTAQRYIKEVKKAA